MFPPACSPTSLCWNAEDVLGVIHQHRCVVAYLGGHDHDGGDAVDGEGICHVTMPGVVERAPGEVAFATADVYRHVIDILGQGVAKSFRVALRYPVT